MKKRIVALLFSLLFVLSAVGCENVVYIEEISQTEEVNPPKNNFEQLESMLPPIETDEELPLARDFIVLTSKPSLFTNDENSPKTINTAVEKRNELIKNKYGTNIRVLATSEADAEKTLKNASLSGAEVCDMISLSAEKTVSLYLADLLGDMNTLPDFNLDSEFFNGAFSKSLATNNSLYLLPDVTNIVYEDSYVIFFNRELILSSGAENPETLVAQGNWTWDKFNEISRLTAKAVYNKGSADLETDVFGYGSYYGEKNYPLAIWTSCDTKVIDNNYKNPIEFTASIDDIVVKTEKLRSLYNTKGKFPLIGDEASNAFEENRIVFFCNKLEYLYALRDGTEKGSQFGFVPMPKYDSTQQNYACLLDNDAHVLSVPKTVHLKSETDKKYVTAVISATCAASKTTVKDAFINYIIAQYLNTNEETVMLGHIADSVVFDFGAVYGSQIREIRRATTAPISDYIEFGSGIRASFANAMSAFKRYCSDNFV